MGRVGLGGIFTQIQPIYGLRRDWNEKNKAETKPLEYRNIMFSSQQNRFNWPMDKETAHIAQSITSWDDARS